LSTGHYVIWVQVGGVQKLIKVAIQP
jgi:hypothetical protein